jgi:hypothetical protein
MLQHTHWARVGGRDGARDNAAPDLDDRVRAGALASGVVSTVATIWLQLGAGNKVLLLPAGRQVRRRPGPPSTTANLPCLKRNRDEWARLGLNQRPLACEAIALSSEKVAACREFGDHPGEPWVVVRRGLLGFIAVLVHRISLWTSGGALVTRASLPSGLDRSEGVTGRA